MAQMITHEGVVTDISNNEVSVRIMQASACSACQAKGNCMAADSKEKIINCLTEEQLQIGDKVRVEIKQNLAWLAVLIAFIIPFVWLMTILYILQLFYSEEIAGTLTFCSLLIYYGIIALFRGKLKRTFNFKAYRL